MKLYDEFADIYDQVSKGVDGEEAFYLKEARKSRGPVLEVACGTGRILLPLLKAGVDIEGFDISKKMLDVLHHKAVAQGLEPKAWVADMRSFRSKKRYDLIIVPYRAFNHCESADDQIKTLRNLRSHLKKGGKIVMNFFYPSFTYMSRMDGRTSIRHPFTSKGKRYLVQEETSYDPIGQIARVHWILRNDSCKTRRVLRTRIAYIYKKEFELLLKLSGFSRWAVHGGFKGEPLKDERQEMVWFIEK